MPKKQHPDTNELVIYRRRMRLSQKQVAAVLGLRSTSMLSRYESGRSIPPLLTALRLEILYRVPVAFLYVRFYRELKVQVRRKEAEIAGRGQLTLF